MMLKVLLGGGTELLWDAESDGVNSTCGICCWGGQQAKYSSWVLNRAG